MKRLYPIYLVYLVLGVSFAFGQAKLASPITGNYVLEVTYIKGRQLAYQRIGGWTWYEGLGRINGFKAAADARPVEAVKLYTREEDGTVKVRVTVLRGANLEFEDNVAEYSVGTEKVIVRELASFGITPFEIMLVRAPATSASMPTIENSTKALLASAEPVAADLPSFKVRVLNGSPKSVAGFAYHTSLEGRVRFTGMPQQLDGTALIPPGSSYEKILPFALQQKTESDGEMAKPLEGLKLHITAVIFMDGTFEGDRIDAARFRGYKIGEKIQLARILELLHSKSAASWDTLAPKVDQLSYRISVADIGPLLTEFQGLPDAEVENLRSAAEVSANRIDKDFVGTFGTGKTIDPSVFSAAVAAAAAKCQKWFDSLP
jgi:hypothetical protein